MTTLSGEYSNTEGTVIRLKDNSTLNLSGVSKVVGATGFPAILVESGSLLNVVDCGKISSTNAPAIYARGSRINVANTNQVSSNKGIAIKAEDSNVIISNLNVLSGSVPITMQGECHVNVNRIRTVNISDTDDKTFIRGTGTHYGSLLVQNMNLVDGSIEVLDMDVTLLNVRTVRTTRDAAAISFIVSDAKGSYNLKISGPTLLSGADTALRLVKGTADLRRVNFEGKVVVTDSILNVETSKVTKNTNDLALFTGVDSTITGTRTLFDELSLTNSHLTLSNCTVLDLTTDSSSVVTYHSLVNGDVASSNRTALWLHNSKVTGDSALTSGSSMVGSAADIADVTSTASFFGSYGGVYGAVTTSSLGAGVALGSSSGTIDSKAGGNVISALTDTLTIYANNLALESILATTIKTGTTLEFTVGSNYKNTVAGTYDDKVTGTYNIDATGATKIKTASTFDVDATGDVTIKGAKVYI